MRNDFDGVVIEDRQVVEDAVFCHNLSVEGTAEFMSEVEADYVDISGEACFDVYVSCDKLTVRNRCVCKSSLLTTSVRVFGAMAIYGKLHSETVIVGGALKFRDSFRPAALTIRSGSLVKGSAKLRASRCTVNGVLNNSGVLISDNLLISSDRASRIQEIRCDKFLAKYNSLSGRPIPEGSFLLISDFVDCFTADLEYCNIERLYCDSAVIRKGCTIHEILYRDSIEIEQGARVERLSKT